MIKSVLATTALAALTFALPAQAVTLVAWDYQVPPADATGAASPLVAASIGTGTSSGLHASATTAWTTPVGNGSSDSFSSNGWAVNDYWQFSFSTTGYTGLGLTFDQTGSSTGPRDFAVTYSTNGTTFTTFASYAVLVNAAPNPVWNATTLSSLYTFTYDLSSITALNNGSTVFIRLVNTTTTSIGGATTAAGGTNRIDNVLITATPVPESSTSAMLVAGIAALGFMASRRNRA